MYANPMNYGHLYSLALVDHQDSFTYNIVSWLKNTGIQIQVFRFDDPELQQKVETFSAILYSPGPGHPQDYHSTHQLMTSNWGKKPQIGICLGMQMMLLLKGNAISKTGPVHGKVALVRHNKHGIFNKIKSPVAVARYHSLGSMDCQGFMRTAEMNGITMGIENDEDKILGVQFHPESFLTHHADQMAINLLEWIKHYD